MSPCNSTLPLQIYQLIDRCVLYTSMGAILRVSFMYEYNALVWLAHAGNVDG